MWKFVTALLGSILVVTPTMASSAERAPAPLDASEQIAWNPWVPIAVGLIAAALIICQVFENDDDPASP